MKAPCPPIHSNAGLGSMDLLDYELTLLNSMSSPTPLAPF